VEFRVLGPVEVHADGQQLPIRGPIQQGLLALLAVHANRVVASHQLLTSLWEPAAPAAARRSLQWHIWQLRRLLGSHAHRLVYRAPGYLLRVEPGELDLERFQQLVDQGREALAAGDAEGASRLLAAALGLWRGPAFEDVEVAALAERRARLERRRLAVVEDRVQADLDRGRHTELAGELEGLVAAQPLRERLCGLLMVALYRSGRQSDALAAFRSLRERLVEQQAVEPGRPLQELQRQILTADPALDPPAGTGRRGRAPAAPQRLVPRQLPPDVASFTGREPELVQLEQALAAAGEQGPVVISAIQGTGGIGKSALAIHAAHRLAAAGRFPDGQLYVNLQGATAGLQPLAPLEVLGRFLRALGMEPAGVPGDLEEASAAFRSRVAGRRLLVVLDNARSVQQVHPLLPGTPSCGVLVTSRQTLASLDGARHLHLDVLAPDEAVQLLGRLAGGERVAAEPEATAEVAHCCGWLPLALRVAGARLAARPGWPVRALAERLADAQRRLDELQVAKSGVRASFAVSWEQLSSSDDPVDRAAAHAFSLLGTLDGPEVGIPVAARLLDQPEDAAEGALERLVDAQLLETPSPGRYRMHDLLRLYAREQAGQRHSEAERAAALTRALGFYVATVWQTLALLRRGDTRLARADDRWRTGGLEFPDEQPALDWLEAERANLLAAVRQAAATSGVPPQIALQLGHALFGFFVVRGHWRDWVQVNQTALGVARRLDDRYAEGQTHNDLGLAYFRQGCYGQALACFQESLAIRRRLNDRKGLAGTLGNLGNLHERQGRHDEALACQRESLTISRELDDPHGQAISLSNLGNAYERLGDYQQARRCQQESLALFRRLGDRRGQANSLANLGEVHGLQGHYDQARAYLLESLAIRRELGDRVGQAHSLNELGIVDRRQGRHDEALACQRESLTIYRELDDPHGEAESLRELGMTLRALGLPGAAQEHWRQALAIFEQLRTTDAEQVRALLAGKARSGGADQRA
jgi:DNA-binding SARP family transcriptional activator/tetratricopeptide (TPR) repeat protein